MLNEAEPIPLTKIAWWVDGCDQDPRPLWEIPEVASHIRRLTTTMGWENGPLVPRDRLDDATIALLVKCGCFGDRHPFRVIIRPGPAHEGAGHT